MIIQKKKKRNAMSILYTSHSVTNTFFFFLLSAYFVALHFELNICYKINVFLTCASLIVIKSLLLNVSVRKHVLQTNFIYKLKLREKFNLILN